MSVPAEAVEELIAKAKQLLRTNQTLSARDAEPMLTGFGPVITDAAIEELRTQIANGGDEIARAHSFLVKVRAEMT